MVHVNTDWQKYGQCKASLPMLPHLPIETVSITWNAAKKFQRRFINESSKVALFRFQSGQNVELNNGPSTDAPYWI